MRKRSLQPSAWLNERRIRVHGLLLAVCLWSLYALDLSTPGLRDRNGLLKGTDFLQFYILGTLARQGHGDLLYNMAAQFALTTKLLPEARGTVYTPVYGPQISLLFAPFSRLSYGWALIAWMLLNTAIYAFCCYAVWRTCPNLRRHGWTVVIVAATFPGFFHLLACGQTSGLALACFTLAFLALRGDYPFLAGLAIGSLVLKPQLGAAAAVVFVCARAWRLVSGAALSAACQMATGWLHYGTRIMRDYWQDALRLHYIAAFPEFRPGQTHSLRSFWLLLLPHSPLVVVVLYGVSALAILVLAFRTWRSSLSLQLRYSALLIATVLVSPHLVVYDLVILAPAFLLLGDWVAGNPSAARRSWVPTFLYLCFPLFLLGPLARFTHLQFSVLVMVGLLWILAVSFPSFSLQSSDATLATP